MSVKIVKCPDIYFPESKDDTKQNDIKIVHISDTHLKHINYETQIPNGDILIHSGDFLHKSNKDKIKDNNIEYFNQWLGKLPHKHKIVIAGNHEIYLTKMRYKKIQKRFTNAIYLQDNSVQLYGLNIYGTPWHTPTSNNLGFAMKDKKIYKKWNKIPNNTDILITHLPPYGIFDLAWKKHYNNTDYCKICNRKHLKFNHWGNINLKQQILTRIKPRIHLFGHVHDQVGYKHDKQHNILFVNSAMDIYRTIHTINIKFGNNNISNESNINSDNMDDIKSDDTKNDDSNLSTMLSLLKI